LPASRGFIDVGGVPLSAARALETRFHDAIMPQLPRDRHPYCQAEISTAL
jgi:hypothetical protein